MSSSKGTFPWFQNWLRKGKVPVCASQVQIKPLSVPITIALERPCHFELWGWGNYMRFRELHLRAQHSFCRDMIKSAGPEIHIAVSYMTNQFSLISSATVIGALWAWDAHAALHSEMWFPRKFTEQLAAQQSQIPGFWEPFHLRAGSNFMNDLHYSHLSNRTWAHEKHITLVISRGYATSGNTTDIKVMFSLQCPQLHYQWMFALQSTLAVDKEQNTYHLYLKSISVLFML